MSVTMHLWKPIDVKYMGCIWDTVKPSAFNNEEEIAKIEEANGFPSHDDPDYITKWNARNDEMEKEKWSDGKFHSTISYCHWHLIRNQKNWYNKLEQFHPQIHSQVGITEKIIPVEEIAYDQGWFFKRAFFKREMTIIYCTSWKQIDKVWKRYIKVNKYTCRLYERFRKSWEDGMIFEIAF